MQSGGGEGNVNRIEQSCTRILMKNPSDSFPLKCGDDDGKTKFSRTSEAGREMKRLVHRGNCL